MSTLWNKEDIIQAIELLTRLRAIRDDESRSTIEQELIAQIPESLRKEGLSILSDEKMRRKLTQDILTAWVRSLWKRWINVALVTLGGEKKADGWLVVEVPAIRWQESFFVIAIRWKTLIAKTFEDGLDILSKENVSPVFTHYLVDLNGDILGEVTTRLSGKMKDILFPTEARITGWMRHPETLPKGTEIWFRYGNEGKSINITHISNAGWFTETGISESSLDSLTIMASHLTIWYVKHGEYGWFQAHYTGTRVHAYGAYRRKKYPWKNSFYEWLLKHFSWRFLECLSSMSLRSMSTICRYKYPKYRYCEDRSKSRYIRRRRSFSIRIQVIIWVNLCLATKCISKYKIYW